MSSSQISTMRLSRVWHLIHHTSPFHPTNWKLWSSSSPSWYWSNSGNFCTIAFLRHAGKEPNFDVFSVNSCRHTYIHTYIIRLIITYDTPHSAKKMTLYWSRDLNLRSLAWPAQSSAPEQWLPCIAGRHAWMNGWSGRRNGKGRKREKARYRKRRGKGRTGGALGK